jgi:hypothetical protein
MTFLELCQTLRREVGAAGTGPANVEGQTGEYARLVEWIRNSWIRIQETHERWRFAWAEGSVEIEPAFREYELSSDVALIDSDAIYRGDTKLTVVDWHQFREDFREPSGADIRRVSFSPDGLLRLEAFPKQSELITFEYWREPQRLVANTDVPRCPAPYHLAIVYAAMVQYGLYENAQEVVQQARLNYSGVYQQMVNRELPTITLQGPLA